MYTYIFWKLKILGRRKFLKYFKFFSAFTLCQRQPFWEFYSKKGNKYVSNYTNSRFTTKQNTLWLVWGRETSIRTLSTPICWHLFKFTYTVMRWKNNFSLLQIFSRKNHWWRFVKGSHKAVFTTLLSLIFGVLKCRHLYIYAKKKG